LQKSPEYVITNLGTCDDQLQLGLIVTFSQFYLKLNLLYDIFKNNIFFLSKG